MRYSQLGNTGMNVSALGFGCMRLPMENGKVVREKSTPLLRAAYEKGVNFFDTAIGYCGADSQPAVGEALEPFRDKVFISTKNHLHSSSDDEWWAQLENSLKLLRTDHLDLYNHHGISWKTFTEHLDPDKGGKTKLMLKAKEQGLVRHVGFSFHAPPEDLMKLADTGLFENVILQYNLLDQANAEAMQYVNEKGMGIVVMGPVGGGRLGLASDAIKDLTGGAAQSTPEAALRFVWAHPAVNVALSGMENIDMLEQNVQIADNTEPFTADQTQALNNLVQERKKKSGLYCSGCRYCMPECPNGVSIPEQLDLLNLVKIYGLNDAAKQRYESTWSVKVKASECIQCGKCSPKCPQNIDIPARMREVVTLLDSRAGAIAVETSLDSATPDGTFGLRLKAHSLADTPCDLKVTLTGAEGVSFDNATVDFGQVAPFGRVSKATTGQYAASSGRIAFGMDIAYADRQEHVDKTCEFVFLTRGVQENWDGEGWQEIPAPADAFTRNADTAASHGARFKLSYDDDTLVLLADVKDDFLAPSREAEHKGKLVDSVELFLDGRAPSKQGASRYEDGVHQITLYPGTPGSAPAFYNAKADLPLDVSSEKTDGGYRLTARLPFSAFCTVSGTPKKIGFDLAVNTADAEGERIAQFVWAGGPDNWQDASKFREVWLV